jgi:hypothetical protein
MKIYRRSITVDFLPCMAVLEVGDKIKMGYLVQTASAELDRH